MGGCEHFRVSQSNRTCFTDVADVAFAVIFLSLRNVSADNAILVVCSSEVNPMMESQKACFPE